jgi:hypothetical protein
VRIRQGGDDRPESVLKKEQRGFASGGPAESPTIRMNSEWSEIVSVPRAGS